MSQPCNKHSSKAARSPFSSFVSREDNVLDGHFGVEQPANMAGHLLEMLSHARRIDTFIGDVSPCQSALPVLPRLPLRASAASRLRPVPHRVVSAHPRARQHQTSQARIRPCPSISSFAASSLLLSLLFLYCLQPSVQFLALFFFRGLDSIFPSAPLRLQNIRHL